MFLEKGTPQCEPRKRDLGQIILYILMRSMHRYECPYAYAIFLRNLKEVTKMQEIEGSNYTQEFLFTIKRPLDVKFLSALFFPHNYKTLSGYWRILILSPRLVNTPYCMSSTTIHVRIIRSAFN